MPIPSGPGTIRGARRGSFKSEGKEKERKGKGKRSPTNFFFFPYMMFDLSPRRKSQPAAEKEKKEKKQGMKTLTVFPTTTSFLVPVPPNSELAHGGEKKKKKKEKKRKKRAIVFIITMENLLYQVEGKREEGKRGGDATIQAVLPKCPYVPTQEFGEERKEGEGKKKEENMTKNRAARQRGRQNRFKREG